TRLARSGDRQRAKGDRETPGSHTAGCLMIIDCHVHISALTPGHGMMSEKLLDSIAFRFMQRRLNLPGRDVATERALEAKLALTLDGTEKLDAAVILAFDAVHSEEGQINLSKTH